MGASYNIFGATVRPHVLAIATIGAVVGGVTLPKYFKAPQQPVNPNAAAAAAATTSPAAVPDPQPIDTPQVAATGAPSNGEIDVEKAINDFLKSTETVEAKK